MEEDTISNLVHAAIGDPEILRRIRSTGLYITDFSKGWAVSSLLLESFGYSNALFSSEKFEERIHPDDLSMYKALWDRIEDGWENELSVEFRFRDKTGAWRWIHTRGTVLTRMEDGKPALFAGVDSDITTRKETEAILRDRLAEEERRFALAETLRMAGLAASSSVDSGKTLELILEQSQQFIPYEASSIRSYDNEQFVLRARHPCDDELLPHHGSGSPIHEVVAERSPRISDDISSLLEPREDSAPVKYRSWMGIPLILRRELLGVLEFWHSRSGWFKSDQLWPALTFSDTLSVALANQYTFVSLLEDSRTDPLTGLWGRRYFDDAGRQSLNAMAERRERGTLVLMDIDRFKSFNDKYGHLMGDEVLRVVARVLREVLRGEDILCRFGGEEFVALLPRVNLEKGLAIAERIRARLEETPIPGIDTKITASFGAAEYVGITEESLNDLIERADKAMYAAKQAGRNRVVAADHR